MVSTMCFAGLEPLVCVNVRPASVATFRNWVALIAVGPSDCPARSSAAAPIINSAHAAGIRFNGCDSLRACDPALRGCRFPARPRFPAVARQLDKLWRGTDALPGWLASRGLVECVDRLRVTAGLLQYEAEARIVRRSVGPHRRGAIEQSGGSTEVSLVPRDLGGLSNQLEPPLLIGFGEPLRLDTTKPVELPGSFFDPSD